MAAELGGDEQKKLYVVSTFHSDECHASEIRTGEHVFTSMYDLREARSRSLRYAGRISRADICGS